MSAYEQRTLRMPAYDQRMPAYDQRLPAYLKRIQPMPNLTLAYVSVYQRVSEHFIRNSYVSLIRNSVTGPLPDTSPLIHATRHASPARAIKATRPLPVRRRQVSHNMAV